MGRLVRAYDGSGADAALLRTLCTSGAPQAALALAAADSTTQVEPRRIGLWVCTSGAPQAALALAAADSHRAGATWVCGRAEKGSRACGPGCKVSGEGLPFAVIEAEIWSAGLSTSLVYVRQRSCCHAVPG